MYKLILSDWEHPVVAVSVASLLTGAAAVQAVKLKFLHTIFNNKHNAILCRLGRK